MTYAIVVINEGHEGMKNLSFLAHLSLLLMVSYCDSCMSGVWRRLQLLHNLIKDKLIEPNEKKTSKEKAVLTLHVMT